MVEKDSPTKVKRVCVECGSEKLRAHGVCHTCYCRQWRKKRAVIRLAEKQKRIAERECYACGNKETWKRHGIYPEWVLNPPIGLICSKCYKTIFRKTYHERWWRSPKASELNKRREFQKQQDAYIRYRKYRGKLFDILNQYGCQHCGESDWRCLQFDHRNGGGCYYQKKYRKQGTALLSFYINNPIIARQDLQVLCANCNWKKRFDNQEDFRFMRTFVDPYPDGDESH